MAKYIKHNSNYIRTDRHQFLKGGSTIFERDWVTIGSQLHFGPGKVPYYNNGNFIFTTSPTPFYQKKYRNGVNVATWTYEDVKDASSIVNNVSFDEYTEDIRSFAYYGSCTELVRSSIENILQTFPGMIVKKSNQVQYYNEDESELISSGYYEIINDFGIDLVNDVAKNGEDEFKIMKLSYNDYLLNGLPIKSYEVIKRQMFILKDNECISNRKKESTSSFKFLTQATYKSYWVKQELDIWKASNPDATQEEIRDKENELKDSFNIETCTLNRIGKITKSLYFNDGGNTVVNGKTGSCYFQFGLNTNADNIKTISGKDNLDDFVNTHSDSNSPDFMIPSRLKYVTVTISYDYATHIFKISCPSAGYELTREMPITSVIGKTARFKFYNEYSLLLSYCYLQNVSEEEYNENISEYRNWDETECPLEYWTEKTSFQKKCDIEWNYEKHDWNYILFSKLSHNTDWNQPIYQIHIENENDDGVTVDSVDINAYILNRKVVLMTKYANDLTIKPKDEIIENYFNNLKGFEKQLLTRKSTPLYSNQFITPLEYSLGYVYYKRTYTWPSNGYCIDISSIQYVDFIEKLYDMANKFDELWTDNIWKRMTHEAIKNYDWTYTRKYSEGDEEENIYGGERMHKVINIIGRVFDDIKRSIDTIRQFNRVTYNGDRNIPNALLSDKLDIMGWDVFSTIPTITEVTVNPEDEEETIETTYSASNVAILDDFLEKYNLWWYPTKNSEQITFADVDVDWMRRFILSSKRILSTKGTINSFEMIMAMFGYGLQENITTNNGETKKPFEIWEEYNIVKPKNYDEPFEYVNKQNYSDIIYKDEYDALGDNEKENYELYTTFGDKIVSINMSKYNERLYDEDASGIPVGSFMLDRYEQTQEESEYNTNYLIPFYNQNKWYDGDLYFQSKGGWCYNTPFGEDKSEINPFSWKETFSYLHVVSQVSDLFNVNPNNVKNGDIYYVTSINDYYLDGETGEPLSHFFVLENVFSPEEVASWTNLDLSESAYSNFEDDENKKYSDYAAKARYLNDIIPNNIGNNPHVGYGLYDKGTEYFEYMKKPFKYALDTYNLNYNDMDAAEKIEFNVSENIQAGNIGNIIYMKYVLKQGETPSEMTPENILPNDYNMLDEKNQNKYTVSYVKQDEYENLEMSEKMYYQVSNKSVVVANGYDIEQIYADGGRTDLLYKSYLMKNIGELITNKCYLNNKVIHFKNNIDNEFYIEYFKTIILNYIMQVIPSTAILILEGFELPKEDNNDESEP